MSASWLPIETAPHDLRVLLGGGGFVMIGELTREHRADHSGPVWRLDTLPYVVVGYPHDKGPTHWQPLPDPPTGVTR